MGDYLGTHFLLDTINDLSLVYALTLLTHWRLRDGGLSSNVIIQLILQIDIMIMSWEITLMEIPHACHHNISTLGQVMAWCR